MSKDSLPPWCQLDSANRIYICFVSFCHYSIVIKKGSINNLTQKIMLSATIPHCQTRWTPCSKNGMTAWGKKCSIIDFVSYSTEVIHTCFSKPVKSLSLRLNDHCGGRGGIGKNQKNIEFIVELYLLKVPELDSLKFCQHGYIKMA